MIGAQYKTAGPNPSQVLATEPKGTWEFAFMCGAGLAFGSAMLGFLGSFCHISFMVRPFDFGFEVSFVVLSGFMLALDVPQFKESPTAANVSDWTWRYALFLTTFTGRGIWYMLLGTMVWLSLWDQGGNFIQFIVAAGSAGYLLGLGWYAFRKGFILTRRLNRVRESMVRRCETSDNYYPNQVGHPPPLNKEQWRAIFEQHDGRPHSDIEMDYMIGALSMKPFNTTEIEKDEFDEWLESPWTMYFV